MNKSGLMLKSKSLCYNGNMVKQKSRFGFTLIELSLSLIFISTLSLTVVVVLANAISSYHRSITLNQVNTTGTNLVDDMRLAVQQSSAGKIENMCERIYGGTNDNCLKDHGNGFLLLTRNGSVKMKGASEPIGTDIPLTGVFCTGVYSYIWNSGYLFNTNFESSVSKASLKYNNDKVVSDFKLLKVEDSERAVCVAATRVRGNRVTGDYSKVDVPDELNIALVGLVREGEAVIVDEEPMELLAGSENSLALYDLTSEVSEQGDTAKNLYYYTSFILGTIQGGININASGGFCAAPEEHIGLIEGFDYCAINKFNFAAMANGG